MRVTYDTQLAYLLFLGEVKITQFIYESSVSNSVILSYKFSFVNYFAFNGEIYFCGMLETRLLFKSEEFWNI